jgi:hypothetical protein
VALINKALPVSMKADEVMAQAKKEKRALTPEEKMLVDHADTLRNIIVQVDSFDKLGIELLSSNYVRPALRNTHFTASSEPRAAHA